MSARRTRLLPASAVVALVLVAGVLLPAPTATGAATCPTVAVDGAVTPAPAAAVDWSYCNLDRADLRGAVLTSANLVGTSLRGADLTGATLAKAILYGTTLDGADLTSANLSSAWLLRVRALGATVTGADLRWYNGGYSEFRDLIGTPAYLGSTFRIEKGSLLGPQAIVHDLDLGGVDLTDAKLNGSFLSRVNLGGANLTNAVLTGATLTDVTLTDAVIAGAAMTGIRGIRVVGAPAAGAPGAPVWTVESGNLVGPGALLDGALLNGTDLSGRDLKGLRIKGGQLTDVDLTNADLTSALFMNAVLIRPKVDGLVLTGASGAVRAEDLQGTISSLPGPTWRQERGVLLGPNVTLTAPDLSDLDLRGASLQGVRITGADLTGTQMAGVSLIGASISGSSLVGARLDGSPLVGAVLEDNDMRQVSLRGADLTSVSSSSGLWAGADFTGATLADTRMSVDWVSVICPDGRGGQRHYQQDCRQPADLVPPSVTMAAVPTFYYGTSQIAYWPATIKDANDLAGWEFTGPRSPALGGTTEVQDYTTLSGSPPAIKAGLFMDDGQRYCLRGRARDVAGNMSAWTPYRCMTSVTDESFLKRSSGWSWLTSTGYYGGSALKSSSRGAWIQTASGRVRQVGVVAATCPTCGSVAFYVGSTKVGSINLARSTVKSRSLLTLPRFSATKYGKVRVVVTSGTVKIDALAVTGY